MSAVTVLDRERWQAARGELLEREKELTRRSDELARMRRELPWVELEKEYRLETETGPRTLAELFDGRSQLVVYHFMFGPDYEAGCPVCSSIADSFNGVLSQLAARDVTMVAVSAAPIERLLDYRRRMGWSFNWASSHDSDFNRDFGRSRSPAEVAPIAAGASTVAAGFAADCGTDTTGYLAEGPGLSVFGLLGGRVHLTYSTGGRGLEPVMSYYGILDLVPRGRDEGGGVGPSWIRRHDEPPAGPPR